MNRISIKWSHTISDKLNFSQSKTGLPCHTHKRRVTFRRTCIAVPFLCEENQKNVVHVFDHVDTNYIVKDATDGKRELSTYDRIHLRLQLKKFVLA